MLFWFNPARVSRNLELLAARGEATGLLVTVGGKHRIARHTGIRSHGAEIPGHRAQIPAYRTEIPGHRTDIPRFGRWKNPHLQTYVSHLLCDLPVTIRVYV